MFTSMRALVVSSILLGSSVAFAGSAPILDPYAPFKLVGVMPDTGQVLLWDEDAAEYRLAKTGDDLDGWRVAGLDLKDSRGPRLSLQRDDLIDELELVRLPRPGAVIVFKATRPAQHLARSADAKISMESDTVATAQPVNDNDSNGLGPVGDIAPTVIEAQPPAPPPPPPAPPPPPPVLEENHILTRADLNKEINDFDKLMASVSVERADGGGFKILRLTPDSWIASLGFRKGDVVRTVAGEPVSSVEDAARVYARLRSLDSFACGVERGPQKLVLKFEVDQ